MEKVLISACLLGDNTKYDGTNNYTKEVEKLFPLCDLVIVCPEVFGGLPTPRYPSEIVGEKVCNNMGEDVTDAFYHGAFKALELARINKCKKAILKAKSPSCGKGKVYDGTFSHTVTNGNGIAARLLMENGIMVFTEEELNNL